jgi:hypothetical protein
MVIADPSSTMRGTSTSRSLPVKHARRQSSAASRLEMK